MSLFPSEHLVVAITPMAVAVVLSRGRWRPSQREAHELEFEAGGLDSALEGLARALDAWAPSGATVRFCISNAFVRVAPIPWSGGRLGAAEEKVLARQCLAELYGDMADWQVQLSCEREYGTPGLAFALPVRLVEPLIALSRQYGLDCRSIAPSAMHSWNCHGKGCLAPDLLFSVVDSGYALLLATQGLGKSRTVVAARMVALASEAGAVESTLRREILLQGLEGETQCMCDAYGAMSQGRLGSVELVPPRVPASVAMVMATGVGPS